MSKVTKGLSTANAARKNPNVRAPLAPKKPMPVHSAAMPEADWQVHDDHRTLMEAEHIKADKGRMHAVRKVAGRKMMAAQAINNLADLKEAAKKFKKGEAPKAGADPTEPGKRYPSGERDMQGENDYHTLSRAQEVRGSSERMRKVKEISAGKMHAAAAIHASFQEKDEP